MSQKSLTVGDIIKTQEYLEQIKSTVNDTEKAEIDELIEKFNQMEANRKGIKKALF